MAKRMTDDQDDELDVIFQALAHPIRRDLLEQLGDGSGVVGELAEPHDVSLAAVSNHLHMLEEAGLVEFEKDGRVRRGTLAPGSFNRARDWLAQDSFPPDDRQEATPMQAEDIDQ